MIQIFEQNKELIAEKYKEWNVNNKEIIDEILLKTDPQQLLQTLHQIQVMQKILNTIHLSVDRASKVIKDIRSFIKEDNALQRIKSIYWRTSLLY